MPLNRDEITPNTASTGSVGTSDKPWGEVHAAQFTDDEGNNLGRENKDESLDSGGANEVTAADLRAHLDDGSIHYPVNDVGSLPTALWSASKTDTEITGAPLVARIDAAVGDDSWRTDGGGGGNGDVVGPVSAVNDNLAAFDGTTGKLIKDSAYSVSSFATATQGGKADTALQPGDALASLDTTVTGAQLNTIKTTVDGLGSASTASSGDFATAAQGALADSAVQPGDIDTIAELNATLTDATLIDTADSRLSDSRTCNNVFDTPATARTNLGVVIGVDVQAYDAALADIAAITGQSTDDVIKWDGNNWIASPDAGGSGSSTLDGLTDTTITGPTSSDLLQWNGSAWVDRSFAEAGLGIGTDIQAQNAILQLWADISPSNNDLFVWDGGTLSTIAAGADGYVLTSSAGAPAWAAATGGASALPDLSDVVSATNTNRFALMANGTTGYVGRALVEADISDLGSYALASHNHTGTYQPLDSALTDIAAITGQSNDDVIAWDGANWVAAAQSGGGGLTDWSEDGSGNLIPDTAGQNLGSSTNEVGSIYVDYLEAIRLSDSSAADKGRLSMYNQTLYLDNVTASGDTIFRTGSGNRTNLILKGSGARLIESSGGADFDHVLFDSQSYLYSDGADILAQRNGSNAQEFRIYNDATDTSTDFERAKLAWESNEFVIGTESDGVNGTVRGIGLKVGSSYGLVIPSTSDDGSALLAGVGASSGGIRTTIFGQNASTTSTSGAVFGNGSRTDGKAGTALGYAVTADGYSSVVGSSVWSRRNGSFVWGVYDNYGDGIGGLAFAQCVTTDATETILGWRGQDDGNSTSTMDVPTDSSLGFEGIITARRTDATGGHAKYHVEGLVTNESGTVTLEYSSVTTKYESDAAWGVSVSRDDTNNCLTIKVTGEASKTIAWTGHFLTVDND